MYQIVIIIHMLASDARIEFTSETKFPTLEDCQRSIPAGMDQLRRHVLDHMIEEFDVDQKCRPVEEGA